MTGRRTRRRPLEGSAITPRVVHGDLLAIALAVRYTFKRNGIIDRASNTDPTVESWFIQVKPVLGEVGGVTTGHTHDTQPVLDEEGHVEADEQNPEMNVPQRLVEHLSGELRPPEVETCEHREHHCSKDHVVEVSDHESNCRRRGSPGAAKPG